MTTRVDAPPATSRFPYPLDQRRDRSRLGALMFPVYLAQAVSPLLAAWIWQLHGNYDQLEIVLLIAAGVSAAAFVLAARMRPTPVLASL